MLESINTIVSLPSVLSTPAQVGAVIVFAVKNNLDIIVTRSIALTLKKLGIRVERVDTLPAAYVKIAPARGDLVEITIYNGGEQVYKRTASRDALVKFFSEKVRSGNGGAEMYRVVLSEEEIRRILREAIEE